MTNCWRRCRQLRPRQLLNIGLPSHTTQTDLRKRKLPIQLLRHLKFLYLAVYSGLTVRSPDTSISRGGWCRDGWRNMKAKLRDDAAQLPILSDEVVISQFLPLLQPPWHSAPLHQEQACTTTSETLLRVQVPRSLCP